MDIAIILGFLAGLLTTGANVPQVITSYKRRSCEGLSFRMLLSLALGLALWLTYGVVRRDLPIIIFNAAGLSLTVSLIAMKFHFDRHPTAE